MKVVVIEDTEEIVESIKLCIAIRWPDCAVLSTPRGKDGLRLVQSELPDLVILDLVLADGNGLDVLKDIRGWSDVPVIIVSVKGDEVVRVRGLELGADDFVAKPFSHTELLARMRAVLRRTHMPSLWQDAPVVKGKNLTIDLSAGRAFVDGQETELSATEWKLLIYLARNEGRIIPPDMLASKVWGVTFVEPSTIKMCVRRLRVKLGDDTRAPRIIRSHRGRGYSFELGA
ncbi:MAG TPA: response regulator transcription factor [Spirochaetia bacterium]|nr:response regulator transcription factor [Spirochaetia bacterium]